MEVSTYRMEIANIGLEISTFQKCPQSVNFHFGDTFGNCLQDALALGFSEVSREELVGTM